MNPALAASYAGTAAQEEDTVGLPTYAQFKKYAKFRTDITDFGVDLRQLTSLLAECDYGICAGGMGLGDLNILFTSITKRLGALNYDGVLRLCRLLRPRLSKVQAEITAVESARSSRNPTLTSSANLLGPNYSARGKWAAVRGSIALGSNRQIRLPGDPDTSSPQDASADREPGTRSPRPDDLGPISPGRAGTSGPKISAVMPRAQEPRVSTCGLRPASAGRLPTNGSDGSALWAGPGGSGRGSPAVPDGLSTLMALRDPPVLIRERLPPPPCSFPSITARIAGIQALYREGEMTRVVLALRELQRDWEKAAAAKAIAQAVRRQAKAEKASGGGVDALEEPPRGEIPLEGRIWLLLIHSCALMLDGQTKTARRILQAAEALFNPNILGLEHPFNYCIHLLFGLLSYYEQQYEEAINKFDSARELAELVARGLLDTTARRNAAACLNNMGVCHSLLGKRSEAVKAFRAAHQQLRALPGVPEAPEAVVAQRNLNKALKLGFALNTTRLRPTSAPPMYAHVGSTSIPSERKLQTFLQSAVTMHAPAPLNGPPAWSQKVTADDIVLRKKIKEAEKKAKAKAAERGKNDKGKGPKVKKAPPFEAMATYPFASYGVANVKLAVKRARKKKAAK